MLDKTIIIRTLRKIKMNVNEKACLGCNLECKCDIHGCDIINQAIAYIQMQKGGEIFHKERENLHYTSDDFRC